MNILTVVSKQHTYPIYFENSYENLKNAAAYAGLLNRKAAVITDSLVETLYLKEVLSFLGEAFSEVHFCSFPHGEQNKNLDTVRDIYKFLAEKKLDRQSVLFALGGGVTGDITGFAASTYMRGINFASLPTTLLSQVDSGVGGKTGVDFLNNKNLIGSFYQPRFVYINTKTLQTLPQNQFASGLGEVIKHGLIRDKLYYEFILSSAEKIINREAETLERLIEGSCKIKAGVVEKDEREEDLRQILNFGHTFGHALESLSGFTEPHGLCVAHGIRGGLYLSKEMGHISGGDLAVYDALLKSLNFTNLPRGYDPNEVYGLMFSDKKTKNGKLNIIALKEIGGAYVESESEKETVMKSIEYILEGAAL